MSLRSLPLRQRISNSFILFTATWSSVIMPVMPSYGKMLTPDELPTLASEPILTDDNKTERFLAEQSKNAANFLSQKKKTQDLGEMAQEYVLDKASEKATNEVSRWMSKAGNAKVSIDIDKNLTFKNSRADWLIPWYDKPEILVFTQHSAHRTGGRIQTNNGIGLRRFTPDSMAGVNAFIDYDISGEHTRAGLGVEYWKDYLKLSANSYLRVSSWKNASELNDDFNARPANGWDMQVEGWLPAYPNLGGNIKLEQYYGDDVALFSTENRQKDPLAATVGINWTPFSLLSISAEHRISHEFSDTTAKLQLTWELGKNLADQFDPSKVANSRRLMGNRYDFVTRNNNMVLEYQKKTLLSLSLPNKIEGMTGDEISIISALSSKYPLDKIVVQAPQFTDAGGKINLDGSKTTLRLPSYKVAMTNLESRKINTYIIKVTAFDTKGNASPQETTLVEVTNSGTLSIRQDEIMSSGNLLANGQDINTLKVIVRDIYGNIAPDADVTFTLPPAIKIIHTKATDSRTAFQNLFKKMQAAKSSTDKRHRTVTNIKGEASIQFTSTVPGEHRIQVQANHGTPVESIFVFQVDSQQAHINTFSVLSNNAIADGKAKNIIRFNITDNYGHPIPSAKLEFDAKNANVTSKSLSDKQGNLDIEVSSLIAGPSKIIASLNGNQVIAMTNFVFGQLAAIHITEISRPAAGDKSTITLLLTDQNGNPVSKADGTITANIDGKPIAIMISETHVGSGVYTGVLPPQNAGSTVLSITIDGQTSSVVTLITAPPKAIAPINSEGTGTKGEKGVIENIEIKPGQTQGLQSGNTLDITVTITDAFGNGLTGLNTDNLDLGYHKGDTLNWVDNADGSYTTTLPLTQTGSHEITANFNGEKSPQTQVQVGNATGTSNVEKVEIIQLPPAPTGVNGTLVINLKDKNGNPVVGENHVTVIIDGNTSTLPVIETHPGTYEARLTGQNSGNHDVTVTVNDKESPKQPWVIEPPKPIIPQNTNGTGIKGQYGVVDKVTITTGNTVGLKSGDSLELLVTILDGFGNGLSGLNTDNIQLGSITDKTLNWVDNGDGSYTGTLPLTQTGIRELVASINGEKSQPIQIHVSNATGTSHVDNIEIVQLPPSASGSGTTLQVKLTDKNGNPVVGENIITVKVGQNTHKLSVIETQPGLYLTELSGVKAGSHEVVATVNGKESSKATWVVDAPTTITPTNPNGTGHKGAQGVVSQVAISTTSTGNLQSGDTLDVTVTVTDAFGNSLAGLNTDNIHLGNYQGDTLNWLDNGDGSYSTTLQLNQTGAHDLTAQINGQKSQTTQVNVNNSTDHNKIAHISLAPISTTEAGGQQTITVQVMDSHRQPITQVASQISVNIDGQVYRTSLTESPSEKGSYSAILSGKISGQYTVTATVNGLSDSQQWQVKASQSISVVQPNTNGNSELRGMVKHIELTSSATNALKSGHSLQLTVRLKDAFGNTLTGVKSHDIQLKHKQTTNINWHEQQDGRYTALLPLTKVGQDTLSVAVNNITSSTLNITVNPSSGATQVSQIDINPMTNLAAGEDSTVTLHLKDQYGQPVIGVQDSAIISINGVETLLKLKETATNNGIYTGELTGLQTGTHKINIAIGGIHSAESTLVVDAPSSIRYNPNGADAQRGVIHKATLAISPNSKLHSGDTIQLTVTLKDAFHNGLLGVDLTNSLTHRQNSTINWTDNHDGTYTGQLMLTQIGQDPLFVTIGQLQSQTVFVDVAAQAGNTSIQKVEIIDITKPAAGAESHFTVALTDNNGNAVSHIQDVTVSVDGKPPVKVAVTQQANGHYQGTLAGQHAGSHQITVNANGKDSTVHPLNVAKADTTNASLDGSGTQGQRGVVSHVLLSINPNSGMQSGEILPLTVTLQDNFGNPLKGVASEYIILKNRQARAISWVDHNNGSYTTSLPLTVLGQDQLVASVNKIASSSVSIDVTHGQQVSQVKKVTLNPITASSAGQSTTITLSTNDINLNGVTKIADSVHFTLHGQLVTLPLIESASHKGIYTATVPAQKAGTYTLKAKINGLESQQIWTVLPTTAITSMKNDGSGPAGQQGVVQHIELSSSSISNLRSGDQLKLTITLRDAFDNILTGIDNGKIGLTHVQNNPITWVEQKNGSYTSTLTLSTLGQDRLVASINNVISQPIVINVNQSQGNQMVENINVVYLPTPAAGADSILVLSLTDNNGHAVSDVKNISVKINNQTAMTIAVSQLANGNYIATLPGQKSGLYDLVISANGQKSINQTLNVAAPSIIIASSADANGTKNQRGMVDSITFHTTPNGKLKSNDRLTLTLTLQDVYGNLLQGVSSHGIAINHQQTGSVMWRDNMDGTYTAELLLKKIGQDIVKVTVNRISQSQVIDVAAAQGASSVQHARLAVNQKNVAVGESIELQLTLLDLQQNGVEQVQLSDIQLSNNNVPIPANQLNWAEKSQGLYTTTVAMTQQGTQSFSSRINKQESTQVTVNVRAPVGLSHVATVELASSANQLVVGNSTLLTLQLRDKWGNGVEGINSRDITINDALVKGNLSGLVWTYQGNGNYSTPAIIFINGVHSMRASVNQITSKNILIHARPSQKILDVQRIELTANTKDITVGNNLVLSLKTFDTHGNPVVGLNNNTITLTGTQPIPAVWNEDNHGLGIYTATIKLNQIGSQPFVVQLNKLAERMTINVHAQTGKDAVDRIEIANIANNDAGQSASISVRLFDKYNNVVNNVSNGDFTLTSNTIAITAPFLEKNILNTYVAQLPPSKAGTHRITVEVNNKTASTNWLVNPPKEIQISSFDKNGKRGSLETIDISSNISSAYSGQQAKLSITLKDKFGNTLQGATSFLSVITDLQHATTWQELGNGIYELELTMNKLRKQSIQVAVDKMLSDKLVFTIMPSQGATNVKNTLLTIKEAAIEAGEEATVTLTLQDHVGNGVINVKSDDIKLTRDLQPVVAHWANPQDGVYTSKVKLNTMGRHQLQASVDQQTSRIQTIEVTASNDVNKVRNVTLLVDKNSINAGENGQLTLKLSDQYQNPVIDINSRDITLRDSNTGQAITPVIWQTTSAGQYQTSVPLTKVGTHSFIAEVNNIKYKTTDMTVTPLIGASHVSALTLETNNRTIQAGTTTPLTLKVWDKFGNIVANVKPQDIKLKNTDTTISTQASWIKSASTEGVFTANVQLDKVKQHTLAVEINNQLKNIMVEVTPLAGVSHVAQVTLTSKDPSISAGTTANLTLTVQDKFGNPVASVNPQDLKLKDANNAIVSNLTWARSISADNVFTTSHPLQQVKQHTLTAEVNNHTANVAIDVIALTGASHVAAMTLNAPASLSYGDNAKLELTLKDKFGNPVKNVNSADIALTLVSTITATNWIEGKNGTYTAQLTLPKAGENALVVSVNNQTATVKVSVDAPVGVNHVAHAVMKTSLTTTPTGNHLSRPNNNVPLTLVLTDKYNNRVTGVKSSEIELTQKSTNNSGPTNSISHHLTWQENPQQKGEYSVNNVFKQVGTYDLTASIQKATSTIALEVEPHTDAKYVASVELIFKQAPKVTLNETLGFSLVIKDIDNNDVIVDNSAVTFLGTPNASFSNRVVWDNSTLSTEKYHGTLNFHTVGVENISVQIGQAKSTPQPVTVENPIPVFTNGKSTFAIQNAHYKVNSSTQPLVTLELKDKYSKPITGVAPVINITKNSVKESVTLNEIAKSGTYTATLQHELTSGKSIINIDGTSINYPNKTPSVNAFAYIDSYIDTHKDPYQFDIKGNFPRTGFEGATFTIKVPIGSPNEYQWSSDQNWVDVKEGVVMMKSKPTSATRTVKIVGKPKADSGYQQVIDFKFTLVKWFEQYEVKSSSSSSVSYELAQACQSRNSTLTSFYELSNGRYDNIDHDMGPSTRIADQTLWGEWGSLTNYTERSTPLAPFFTTSRQYDNSYNFALDSNNGSGFRILLTSNSTPILCVTRY
ncbi:TPA: invasin domain 3-containing protein [Providencia rettgeri]